jgi:hypothetical protein
MEQDVLRLDVPVDDALGVRVLERRRDIAGDAQRLIDRQWPSRASQAAQRLASMCGMT